MLCSSSECLLNIWRCSAGAGAGTSSSCKCMHMGVLFYMVHGQPTAWLYSLLSSLYLLSVSLVGVPLLSLSGSWFCCRVFSLCKLSHVHVAVNLLEFKRLQSVYFKCFEVAAPAFCLVCCRLDHGLSLALCFNCILVFFLLFFCSEVL